MHGGTNADDVSTRVPPHLFFPSRGRGLTTSTSNSSVSTVGRSADSPPALPSSPSNFEDQMDTTAAANAVANAASTAIAASGVAPEIMHAITTAIAASIAPAMDAIADSVIQRFAQQQQQQPQQPLQHQQQQNASSFLPPKTPKLPPFDAANVALWLGSAETAFEISRVTDPGTKRAHVLAAIPAEHRLLFQDFLLTPDTTQDGYVALINHIRALFQEKPRQRAARVLRPHNLNGRTPSQFLAALKAEMADMTLDMIAKEILAGVLPANIRAIVTTDTNTPADIATAADAFFSSTGELLEQSYTKPVYMAGPAYADVATEDTTSDSEQETEAPLPSSASTPTFPAPAYANVCAAYRGPQCSRPHQPSRNSRPHGNNSHGSNFHGNSQGNNSQRQGSSNNTGNAQSPSSANLCFYHRRFGNEARNCREGCPRWGNARAGGPQ